MTQIFLKYDVAHYCFLLSLIYSQIELLCFGRSHQWELAVRYRRWGVGHGILERTGDLAVNRRRWGGHGILEMIDNQMLQSEFGPLRYCLVPSTTILGTALE